MAATLAALNNYLNQVLGIDEANARDALNDQGLTAFDDFHHLKEKNIDHILYKVGHPGGMIPNPSTDGPANTLNPGVNLGHVQEHCIKMFWYYIRHLDHIQCPFQPASVTLT